MMESSSMSCNLYLDIFARVSDDCHSILHCTGRYVVDRHHSIILSGMFKITNVLEYLRTHLSPPFSEAPPLKTLDTKMPVSFSSYLSNPLNTKDKPNPF